MWSLLLKPLECIASIRFPFTRKRARLLVGNPNIPDARGTTDWKTFLNARELSRVWGPHTNSPWTPFHCLTLFIAVEYLESNIVGPCEADPWPLGAFQMPGWIDSGTLLFVDLPGPKSAALGTALAVGGCDLVCTFNNWPQVNSVISPQVTLSALIRYATLLQEKRTAYPTPGPVAWLCDADRLGTQPGKPGQFDNRYYIEDSVIPGPNYLRDRGISKIIYITSPSETLKADIAVHLKAFEKAGFFVAKAIVSDTGLLHDPAAIDIPEKTFSTVGFFKSSAGGFGAPVPHPSSGG